MFNFVNTFSQSLTNGVMSFSYGLVKSTQKMVNNTHSTSYTIVVNMVNDSDKQDGLSKDMEKIKLDNVRIGNDMRKAISKYGES